MTDSSPCCHSESFGGIQEKIREEFFSAWKSMDTLNERPFCRYPLKCDIPKNLHLRTYLTM
jgi:hypothetical protein